MAGKKRVLVVVNSIGSLTITGASNFLALQKIKQLDRGHLREKTNFYCLDNRFMVNYNGNGLNTSVWNSQGRKI